MSREPSTRLVTSMTYRGVYMEIVHPHGEVSPTSRSYFDHATVYGWCGYIFLALDQFEDEAVRESLWPEPVPTGIGKRMIVRHPEWLDGLPFHGGVTYFNETLGNGGERGVKVGCDYRHLHDHDEMHDEKSVLRDLSRVVDALFKYTTYLMWCAGDGRLAREEEGTVPERWDRWVSFGYMASDEHFLRHHTAEGKLRNPDKEADA